MRLSMKFGPLVRCAIVALISLPLFCHPALGDDVHRGGVTVLLQRASAFWGAANSFSTALSRSTMQAAKAPSETLTRTASSILGVANSTSVMLTRTVMDATRAPSETLTRTASSLLGVANSTSVMLTRTVMDATRAPSETLTRTASSLLGMASSTSAMLTRTVMDASRSPSETLTRTASSLLGMANSTSAMLARTAIDASCSPSETLSRTASMLVKAARAQTTALRQPPRLFLKYANDPSIALSSLSHHAKSGYKALIRAQASLQEVADSPPYRTITEVLDAANSSYPRLFELASDVITKAKPQVDMLRKQSKRGSDALARLNRRVQRFTFFLKVFMVLSVIRRGVESALEYTLDILRVLLANYKLPIYRCNRGLNCILENKCVLGLRLLCFI